MDAAGAYQLDAHYRGRAISIIATHVLEGVGWCWAGLIDWATTLEHRGESFPTPELAIADGKLNIEEYIDTFDD